MDTIKQGAHGTSPYHNDYKNVLVLISDSLAASYCAIKTGQIMWYIWDNNYQVAGDKSPAFYY